MPQQSELRDQQSGPSAWASINPHAPVVGWWHPWSGVRILPPHGRPKLSSTPHYWSLDPAPPAFVCIGESEPPADGNMLSLPIPQLSSSLPHVWPLLTPAVPVGCLGLLLMTRLAGPHLGTSRAATGFSGTVSFRWLLMVFCLADSACSICWVQYTPLCLCVLRAQGPASLAGQFPCCPPTAHTLPVTS